MVKQTTAKESLYKSSSLIVLYCMLLAERQGNTGHDVTAKRGKRVFSSLKFSRNKKKNLNLGISFAINVAGLNIVTEVKDARL